MKFIHFTFPVSSGLHSEFSSRIGKNKCSLSAMPHDGYRVSDLWGISLNARTCQKNAAWLSTGNIEFKRTGKNRIGIEIWTFLLYFSNRSRSHSPYLQHLFILVASYWRQNFQTRRMWLYKVLSITRWYHSRRWCIVVGGMSIVFMCGKINTFTLV